MKWHPTPVSGVWTGTYKGKSFVLMSFEGSTRTLRGKKKFSAQIES